ncbi:MAG: nuclear transport factor 2 family protein [Reyranella sp.]|nr:nuclear transport factor 2 family protein [Reyranella sp.]
MSAREIEAAHRAFAEAAVRHDLEGISSVFADDAVIMPPDSEMVMGRDAILRHWKGAFDGGLSGLEIHPTDIQIIGDVAIEIGHASLSMAPAGAAAIDINVKYIEIWKKVRGQWRVSRGMWNARP